MNSDVKVMIGGVEIKGMKPLIYNKPVNCEGNPMVFTGSISVYKSEIEGILNHWGQLPPIITSKMNGIKSGLPLVLGKRKFK